MKKILQKLNLFFIVLILFICFPVNGQKLIRSRQTSYYTYIYKITDKEAKKIYKNDFRKVDESFFHTLTASFPTDSQHIPALPPGHYLKTYAEKNKQKFSITTIQNFDVFILNNNTDLCIQIYDLKGNIIRNADVSVRMKTLHFNIKTQSYIDKKSNQKGLLKVSYNGFTTYYNLSRQYNNSFVKRGIRKAVYGTPVKYVWIPVNFIIYLPVDGVKSVIRGWPQGTINRTKNFFVKSFRKVACMFDDYYCGYYTTDKFRRNHTGYIVFNKPKYLPGDTVKFKAFLVTKKGRSVDKQVKVILQTARKKIELTQLAPYRKGGYEYAFFLHDSLQLQLDRNYTVYLELNKRKEYISGSYKYEDYELSKNQLSIRLENKEQFRGQKATLFVKGTDENDLNLQDARVEILVTPTSINKYFDNYVYVPDTLLFLEKKLDPAGETEIVLPDSTFPKINFDYTINVRLLTSDNETVKADKKVNYYYKSEELTGKLLTDSIQFTYAENGRQQHKNVVITGEDNFGNETPVLRGTTPCTTELNPYYSSYIIKSDSLNASINIADEPSLLQCYSKRTCDSVIIVVDNPRNIPFSYTVYKRNSQRAAGYTDSLNIHYKSGSRQNYFVSIRYLWGGRIREENYRIPLVDKNLTVSVIQPKIVYPGQKSHIEVLVTDLSGKPVEGVDLTAFSVTKKFGYSPPAVPYLGKSRKNKTVINNFSFKNFDLSAHPGLNLDYNAWKILAGLDTIEYYRFIYPENTIYRFVYRSPDSYTQFSPFVVRNGEILPVHVIYVDSKPVYFSWSTNSQPYSFRIESGYHQIKLRTSDREIIIDKLYFEPGKKTIISLNEETHLKNVSVRKAEPSLSAFEKRVLYNYIFPYRNNFGERYAYIEQGNTVQFLNPELNTRLYKNFAGPVAGNVTFHLIDSFSTDFYHEPFFEYDFSPGLLKMRSVDEKSYPDYLSLYHPENRLSDLILTRKKLENQWKDYLDKKRYLTARYRYPNSTKPGAGRLLLNFTGEKGNVQDIPLNILVFRYDNHEFLRVYPGNTSLIHELQKGYYKLILFYSGAKYQIEDSVYIQPNGINYYKFTQPHILKKDTFSIYVSKLIEETLFKPYPYYNDEEKELRQIYNRYQQQFRYTGVGDVVEGHVYDAKSGEPLPGVNVLINGTTYGTLTDISGYYSLKVPVGKTMLNFSFIGYVPVDKSIEYNNVVDAHLSPGEMHLDEVVVIGYGTTKKSTLTASAITVVSKNLIRGIPGISGNISQSLQGKVAGVAIVSKGGPGNGMEIRIRGNSTVEFDKTPLIIVNGNVYTGDISELDPAKIQKIETLIDENATAIYGSRGANGVVIIETLPGTYRLAKDPSSKGADYDNTFFEAATKSSSIRENFSDYAFWRPKLTTDEDGKAGFDVTFPDDVTSWETYFLAMGSKRQSGHTEGMIKSYKPLMAQLAVPRFLVRTDTTYALGKVLNYTSDSINVARQFEINGDNKFVDTGYCTNSIVDTLPVVALNDSLSVKYFLEKEDGYFDGEIRKIPVFPVGLEETDGKFYVLDKDTTLQLAFNPGLGKVSLYARADILNILEDEISHIIHYKYSCNEQLASKLKALLAEKNIAGYKGERFKNENEVIKLIRLLRKNQKENGLWGWWKDSNENLWISLHVLEALSHAESLGYESQINKDQIIENLIWKLENKQDFYTRVRILKILNLLEASVNFQSYISGLEKTRKLSFSEILEIIRLKQLCNLNYNLDTLASYKKTTLFGNVYYTDEQQGYNLLTNDLQNTLLVYRILKSDSLDHNETLGKIRNYFLENRKRGYWRNTYESSQIVETILPDLLGNKTKLTKPALTIRGDINKTVTEFPFEMKVDPESHLGISKSGDFPVYFTSYQRYWNSSPKVKNEDFEITSHFDPEPAPVLTAGKEVKLVVHVTVKKDAEYVMINIPIPAGCSYSDKKNYYGNESHREYFKNETSVFCESLSKGNYSFVIELVPRYTGVYTINPAKIELMYFPTFSANNEIKTIKIK